MLEIGECYLDPSVGLDNARVIESMVDREKKTVDFFEFLAAHVVKGERFRMQATDFFNYQWDDPGQHSRMFGA